MCVFGGRKLSTNGTELRLLVQSLRVTQSAFTHCGRTIDRVLNLGGVDRGAALCYPVPMFEPMFPGTDVPRYRCSPVPMFPGTYVPRYLCSTKPMFPGTYVPRYLCSPVPMFPGTYVSRFTANVLNFACVRVRMCVCVCESVCVRM